MTGIDQLAGWLVHRRLCVWAAVGRTCLFMVVAYPYLSGTRSCACCSRRRRMLCANHKAGAGGTGTSHRLVRPCCERCWAGRWEGGEEKVCRSLGAYRDGCAALVDGAEVGLGQHADGTVLWGGP